jgi:hypothetical protein
LNYYNYFTEIEETFVRRRGKNLLLSPIDWAMIEGWQERGIPLHIVLRGIESVFDTFDKNPGPRSIKGLLYCREEVEAQYQDWLSMQAGKSADDGQAGAASEYSQENVRRHIAAVIEKLQAVNDPDLRSDIDRAIVRLEALDGGLTDDFETADKSLVDIENFLDQALLTNFDPMHLRELEKEVAAELKAYKSAMDADTYKQTFRLMLLKSLREERGIPRLSLFYL